MGVCVCGPRLIVIVCVCMRICGRKALVTTTKMAKCGLGGHVRQTTNWGVWPGKLRWRDYRKRQTKMSIMSSLALCVVWLHCGGNWRGNTHSFKKGIRATKKRPSLNQWLASESRFDYHPLIELEYTVLLSHMAAKLHKLSTESISMNELLVSLITQLAHSTVNHKQDSAVLLSQI